MTKNENKINALLNETKTFFKRQAEQFIKKDLEINAIKSLMMVKLYNYVIADKNTKGDQIKVSEEYSQNALFNLLTQWIGKKNDVLKNTTLKKTLYVVVKAVILQLHSNQKVIKFDTEFGETQERDNHLYKAIEFTNLEETENGLRTVIVTKNGNDDKEIVYHLRQNDMAIKYNVLKPTFKIRDPETGSIDDVENVEDDFIPFNNDAITKHYNRIFKIESGSDDNESDYEDDADEKYNTLIEFRDFLKGNFKKENEIAFFHDLENKKVLMDIQEQISTILKKQNKLEQLDDKEIKEGQAYNPNQPKGMKVGAFKEPKLKKTGT